MDVKLCYISFTAMFPIMPVQEFLHPIPRRICPFPCLAGEVVKDKAPCHNRINHIVVQAPLIHPVLEGDGCYFSSFWTCDHKMPWRCCFVCTIVEVFAKLRRPFDGPVVVSRNGIFPDHAFLTFHGRVI